jgi:ribonuclease HIII
MLLKSKALTKIQDIIKQLTGHGCTCSKIVEKQYNLEVIVHYNKQKIKVLVYFGKKGISTIVQGDINSDAYIKVKQIVVGEGLFDTIPNIQDEPDEYIGIDESGKGDLFGPLIISAVLIDENTKSELHKIGVKDSKLLTDIQIKKISRQIRRIIPDKKYSIIIINPEKYNQLYTSFRNLNKLLAWGHSKSIENIVSEHTVSTAISDKFGDEGLIISELSKKKININLIQQTKAERYTAVASASILARDKVLSWFERTSEELNLTVPLGAGDVTNITMQKIASIHGKEILSKLVKLHFKNYVKYSNTVKGY